MKCDYNQADMLAPTIHRAAPMTACRAAHLPRPVRWYGINPRSGMVCSWFYRMIMASQLPL